MNRAFRVAYEDMRLVSAYSLLQELDLIEPGGDLSVPMEEVTEQEPDGSYQPHPV